MSGQIWNRANFTWHAYAANCLFTNLSVFFNALPFSLPYCRLFSLSGYWNLSFLHHLFI